jgi:hypothetical protein
MTAEDWWALVDRNPEDAEVRLTMATWLIDEANDQVSASALRWMGRHGKQPSLLVGRWCWWEEGENSTGGDALPEPLFHRLQGDKATPYANFPTRRAAEQALLDAFRLAVAEGWQPEG